VIAVSLPSPGTRSFDLGAKLQGYFSLPSLHHYLVVDPDRLLLIHHQRGTGDAFETRIATGPRLQLDPPGLDIDLTEVLAG
jgi:Uma2 family endonuclease